jgi:transposase
MNANYKPMSALAEQASDKDGLKESQAKRIFLGIDAHLRGYQVARKIEQGLVGPVSNFDLEGLIRFVQKQLQGAQEVYAVYEAGPLGYVLYRRLEALGVKAYVSAPETLEQGTPRRKTNKFDARKLCGRLYSFICGDALAMRPVWVPSPQQERSRARSRQHDQLVRVRKAISARGRSLLLSQGYAVRGAWWKHRAFGCLALEVAEPWLVEQLALWRPQLLQLDRDIVQLKAELSASQAQERIAYGVGALSLTQLDREIGDWHRFANRRRLACYAGLVPSEFSTGDHQRLGSLTKVGVPRIRTLVVEMAWRLMIFQPDYGPIRHWRQQLRSSNRGLKKKAIVAVARQLLIDLWKLRTGRASAQELHLRVADDPTARAVHPSC